MATFTANQLAEFTTGRFQVVELIDIAFYDYDTDSHSDIVRLTTASKDREVTIGATTYTYLGGLFKSMNSVPDDAEINRRSISISLSGLSLPLVTSIQQNNFVNAPITFRKLILDQSGAQIDDPVVAYVGTIETGKFSTNGQSADLSFSVSHDLYNFTRKNVMFSNNSSFVKWAKDQGYSRGTEFDGIDLVQELPWGRG